MGGIKSLDFEPKFDANGLIAVIAQCVSTGDILMFAFADKEAIEKTIETKYAHYHSRSRGKLWKKGEESGHLQKVVEMYFDCDLDAILLKVEQIGGVACHTGVRSCFFNKVDLHK